MVRRMSTCLRINAAAAVDVQVQRLDGRVATRHEGETLGASPEHRDDGLYGGMASPRADSVPNRPRPSGLTERYTQSLSRAASL